MTKQNLLALVLLLAGIIMVPCGARGQAVTGTLVGTVTDPTGAVVANAPVSITNEGTAAVASSTRQ